MEEGNIPPGVFNPEQDLAKSTNQYQFRQIFDPVTYELDVNFKLTSFSELRGWGCKVPQAVLLNLLEGLSPSQQQVSQDIYQPRIGIGMDSCVVPLRHRGLNLVQTTDFFYPLVDDPFIMGKIACANVLSDLYAMGVTECDNMLMILGVSNKLKDKERDVVIPLMMKGFQDTANSVNTSVTGGQTVLNPWIVIGGTATSVCLTEEIIFPDNAVAGDVLVLTKPLGTQIVVTANLWYDNPEKKKKLELVATEEDIRKAYFRAMENMARLNFVAAKLMHKYNAHGATDVTGFGLLGHAQNLAKVQKNEVSFVIHNLPIIAKATTIAKTMGNTSLLRGFSPETSGGLLICLPREQAAAFCKEIEKVEGYPAWIIGIVEKGDRTARIIDKPCIIEAPSKETEHC